jgi:cell filamentation protein
VPRNKLGVTRVADIHRLEYDALLRTQRAYYRVITAETRFTASLIREMHRAFPGNIYEWAGEYRLVDLSKGDFMWPPATLVSQNMATLEEGALRSLTPCRPGDMARIAHDIAVVHAELLLIHPFRDGNGRLARMLADMMALQAGHPPLDFRFAGRGSRQRRHDYVVAVAAGYGGTFAPLERIIADAIQRSVESSGPRGGESPGPSSQTPT